MAVTGQAWSSDTALPSSQYIFKTEEEMGRVRLGRFVHSEDIYQLTLMHIAIEEGRFEEAALIAYDLAQAKQSKELAKTASGLSYLLGHAELSLKAAQLWLSLDKGNEEAHLNYLLVAAQTGEYEGLTKELQRRLQQQQFTPDAALTEIADFLFQLNQPEAALSIFQEVTAGDYPFTLGLRHILISDFAMQAQDEDLAWDMALYVLEHARDPRLKEMGAMRVLQLAHGSRSFQALYLVSEHIKQYPGHRPVRLFYVHTLLRQGSDELALAELQRMREDNPEDFDLLFFQAQAQYQADRLDEAIENLQQFLDIQVQRRDALGEEVTTAQASTTEAHFLLAQIYQELDRTEDAIAQLAQIDEPAARAQVIVDQAVLYMQLEQYAQAQSLLEQIHADEEEPIYVRALVLNASIYRELGDFEQSLALLQRALKYAPDDFFIRYSMAMLYELMDQPEWAIDELEHVLLRYPFISEAYNGLGYTLADHNMRLDEALQLIERALAMEPESVHIYDSYGWVNYRLGHLDLAQQYLELAWQKEPIAEIGAHLAQLHWHRDERDQAMSYLQAAYAVDPTDRALLETMAMLEIDEAALASEVSVEDAATINEASATENVSDDKNEEQDDAVNTTP